MRVADVLGLLAAGATAEEIIQDYPWLEIEDIPAALAYASDRMLIPVVGRAAETLASEMIAAE